MAQAMARNGRRYFAAHYAWGVIERKYLDTFERLRTEPAAARDPLEPLPGFFRRRARSLRPAEEVLADIPSGPVRP